MISVFGATVSTTLHFILIFLIVFTSILNAANERTSNNQSSCKEQAFDQTNAGDNNAVLLGDDPKVITLKQKTILTYSYNFTPGHLNFLVIQAHTQFQKLSLSTCYNQEMNNNSDTAILKIVSYPFYSMHHLQLDYTLEPPSGISIRTLVTVVTYEGKAPIPGGCCLTCSMEVDPNLVISSKQYYKSILLFQLANIYDYNNSDCSGSEESKPKHYRLQYSIYQYFLEEGNLDNDELFDGISKMLTPSKVKENGNKFRDWNPQVDMPSIAIDTKRGQGIVFNILVFDPVTNAESVYSPAVTYGCSFTAKVDGCDSFGSIVNLILGVCGAIFGLFICFFGKRFYSLYIFGSSMTLFSFIAFVLLTKETEWSHDAHVIGSLCIGIVCGSLVYLLWWSTGIKYLVLYICGLPFGFLVSALVFFTPFGNLRAWNNDVNYWTVFFCMSVTIPFTFLLCLKTFMILVSSLVGAYGFVVGIDMFIGSSMMYIILNVIMKAIVDDFMKYDVPFQSKDYILSGVWAVLTVLGLIVQFITTKGQPALPDEIPRKKRKQKRLCINGQTAELNRAEIDDEDGPMPVLVNSRRGNGTMCDYSPDEERLPLLIESHSRPPRSRERHRQSTQYGTNVVC